MAGGVEYQKFPFPLFIRLLALGHLLHQKFYALHIGAVQIRTQIGCHDCKVGQGFRALH